MIFDRKDMDPKFCRKDKKYSKKEKCDESAEGFHERNFIIVLKSVKN